MLLTIKHLFTPHHTNNHKAKILHQTGLMVLIGCLLLTQSLVSVLKYVPVLPGGMILGYASSITPSQTIDLTNSERQKAGLSSLNVSSELTEAAIAKANHMFQNNYWAHIAPDGTTPWVFIKNAGYRYTVAGENLARDFDDSGSMVNAWMNSPTHKENIVNPKFTEIGIAVVNGKLQGVETTLVVQMFGNKTVVTANKPTTSNTGISTKVEGTKTNEAVKPQVNEVAKAETIEKEIEQPIAQQNELPVLAMDVAKNSQMNNDQVKTMISPLTITKVFSTAIALLIILVLLYDAYYLSKHKVPRSTSKNWAHLSFFGLIAVLIWALSQGSVL